MSSSLDACVATLADLVSMDTTNPGGDEVRLVAYLMQRLQALTPDELIEREVVSPTGRRTAMVYARWGTPRTVVNAHLDTVAATQGWRADPFRLRIEHDRLIGLGTADTKGAIAAALHALHAATPHPVDCAVLFSGDEEQTNSCLPPFLIAPQARDIGAVVVCEPTGGVLGLAHRGIVVLEMTSGGGGGHSCFADTVPAPIAELCRAGAHLSGWAARWQGAGAGEFKGLCFNLANISGGTDYNIVPTEATLLLSLRPPPGTQLEGLLTELESQVASASKAVQVRRKLVLPPFETTSLEMFRPHFGALCDQAVGLGFWTEAALWSEAGINAVVFGPGQMTHAHAAEEYLHRDELAAACATFTRFFSRP